MEAITDLISELWKNYGITGLAFGAVLFLLWKQNKKADARITELEKKDDENQAQQLANYKEMIDEYVELVKGQTEAFSKLTSCLESMNATLVRLESKKD